MIPDEKLENQDQEILWVKIKPSKKVVYVGVFYGPQEKCSNEEADRQFSQITIQVNSLKKQVRLSLWEILMPKLK